MTPLTMRGIRTMHQDALPRSIATGLFRWGGDAYKCLVIGGVCMVSDRRRLVPYFNNNAGLDFRSGYNTPSKYFPMYSVYTGGIACVISPRVIQSMPIATRQSATRHDQPSEPLVVT